MALWNVTPGKATFQLKFTSQSLPRYRDLIKTFGSNRMTLRADSAEQRPYLSNVGASSFPTVAASSSTDWNPENWTGIILMRRAWI